MAVPAELPAHRIADPADAPPLRWGILGPGYIATLFAGALVEGTAQRVQAVGSRSRERAAAFAQRFGCRAYGSYEDLVADPQVEVVYVATPHSEHRDHALLAIAAGKHVVVEKAFTRNQKEAAEVLRAAVAAGVFCAEAMWSRYLPHYDVVRRAVCEGVLGDLQTVHADHGQLLYPHGPERLAAPGLAGGALLDLGVYPLAFAAMLLSDPVSVHAAGTLTATGVDAQEVVSIVGAGGVLAVCTSSMTSVTGNTAVVAGTEARLELDARFYNPTTVRLVAADGTVLDTWAPDPVDRRLGLRYQAAEAARCIAAGQIETGLMPHDETLRVMGLMDAVRADLGVSYPGE